MEQSHEHCWHTVRVLTAMPPIHVNHCCWCGAEQRVQQHGGGVAGHGPFAAPAAREASRDE